jgi:hypothetical protein
MQSMEILTLETIWKQMELLKSSSCFPSIVINFLSTGIHTNLTLQKLRNCAVPVLFVRFEVFTAVNMKNGVFWEIKSQFVPRRKHITSALQNLPG